MSNVIRKDLITENEFEFIIELWELWKEGELPVDFILILPEIDGEDEIIHYLPILNFAVECINHHIKEIQKMIVNHDLESNEYRNLYNSGNLEFWLEMARSHEDFMDELMEDVIREEELMEEIKLLKSEQ